jgi:hypothetical protein
MSWDDYNRRRAAIKAVLAHAETHPADGLPYEYLAEAAANFASRRELLLALQYDWSQALWARIELLSLDGNKKRRNAKLTDAGELARTAWHDCSAKHPVLRRLLDTYRDELGAAVRREQDIMTLAGIGHAADAKVYRIPHVA